MGHTVTPQVESEAAQCSSSGSLAEFEERLKIKPGLTIWCQQRVKL